MIKKVNQSSLFEKHKDDFKYCEKIIKKHSKTFYAAFSTLPKEDAMSVYAVYAFCRKADDIVDEDADLEALNQLWEELRLFEDGNEPNHPIWRALRVVFNTYKMDIAPFYDMIIGQKEDLTFTQPETQSDLLKYSYYVAGSVGLMLLPILTDEPEKMREEAIALGTAMQITNILRDVREDLENNRIYLPKEVMEKLGYSYEILLNQEINQSFIDLWEYEANEAEKYYQKALVMIDWVNEKAKRPLLLSLLLYREIIFSVRSNNYDCFTKRVVVSKSKKLEIVEKANEILR